MSFDTRADMAEAARIGRLELRSQPSFAQLQASAGCLVGSVEVVDCAQCSDSPWFFGQFEVSVLGEGRPRAEGNLGLFTEGAGHVGI